MTTYRAFWPETRRIIAQWVGIAMASVLSGSLLGLLIRQGLDREHAFETALPVGFLLAILFWVLVDRWFLTRSARMSVSTPISPNVPTFEQQPAALVAYSFAQDVTIACQIPVA
jgi:hypothetical protein